MSECNQGYGLKHKPMIIDTKETAKFVYINIRESSLN